MLISLAQLTHVNYGPSESVIVKERFFKYYLQICFYCLLLASFFFICLYHYPTAYVTALGPSVSAFILCSYRTNVV